MIDFLFVRSWGTTTAFVLMAVGVACGGVTGRDEGLVADSGTGGTGDVAPDAGDSSDASNGVGGNSDRNTGGALASGGTSGTAGTAAVGGSAGDGGDTQSGGSAGSSPMAGGSGQTPTAGTAGGLPTAGGAGGPPWTGQGGMAGNAGTGGGGADGGFAGMAGAAGPGGAAGGGAAPTCDDGVLNADEVDVDCGGAACLTCDGVACASPGECHTGVCSDGTCGAPSCADGLNCNGESCCTSLLVPGGTFPMGRGTETCAGCVDGCPPLPVNLSCTANGAAEVPEHPATVGTYALDKYEVTVGRFRAFVEAYDTWVKPGAGDGSHPMIAGSGWHSDWNAGDELPVNRETLTSNVACDATCQTWTAAPGEHATYPMNCVNWYVAFAFCIWDGGRLPTEAEWEYAAAGGDENRLYPWGDDVTEPLPANYNGTDSSPFVAVGSYPAGNGRWGHADLAGSMHELTLDTHARDWYTTTQFGCSDCANLTPLAYRVIRGGFYDNGAEILRAAMRYYYVPAHYQFPMGWRCARTL